MKQLVPMILAFLFIASCSEVDQQDSHSLTVDVSRSTMLTEEVGKQLEFVYEWTGDIPKVYFTGLTTHHPLEARIENQKLYAQVPSSLTSKAGTYFIKAYDQGSLSQLSEIQLSSGRIDGKIVSYMGPKSILNNGEQETEITAFPIDTFRNPTGLGSNIDLNIIDDAVERSEILFLDDDFAAKKLNSEKGTSILVGMNNDQAFSQGNQIRTVSLCPASIHLYKQDNSYVADGRQFFKVWTDFLKDKNGQQITDGTIAELRVLDENKKEVAQYKAYTVNGIVSCWIKNPSGEGAYEIEIKICDQKNRIALGRFSGLVSSFDYEWKGDEILVGPITNSLGQFIPDGSPVLITIESGSLTQTVEKHLVDGYASFTADEFWVRELPAEASVEINNRFYKIRAISL